MRIALVRGPSLNPYEMQNEVPLLTDFSLTAFATTYSPEWNARLPQLPVDYCFWPDSLLAGFPRARWLFNGLCSRALGISFYMQGLEARLANFSIIHTLETHNTYSYQAARAAEIYGKRLLVTVWETIPGRGESHPIRKARKHYVRARADAFIAVTPRAGKMLESEGVPASKIHVIPMGIDQAHFSPQAADETLRSSWNVRPAEFVWLCVSRLVSEKGIDDLLHAFARTPGLGRLVLVGRGPDQKHYEARATQLGIREQITFAGTYPYAQMPRIYASADALVLASRPTDWWEEQFGYCLIEAMACGKPVVATRSGAIPEVVAEAGLLCEAENPAQLGQTMKTLLSDNGLRRQVTQAGLMRAKNNFTHLGTAAKLSALYTSFA